MADRDAIILNTGGGILRSLYLFTSFSARGPRMEKFRMYLTGICPYCHLAERYLKSKGVTEIEKIRVDQNPEARDEMMRITGRRTVPQIFAGETHIGGYDDLVALDQAGGLTPFIKDAD